MHFNFLKTRKLVFYRVTVISFLLFSPRTSIVNKDKGNLCRSRQIQFVFSVSKYGRIFSLERTTQARVKFGNFFKSDVGAIPLSSIIEI